MLLVSESSISIG